MACSWLCKRALAAPPVCTVIDSTGKHSKELCLSLSLAVQNVADMDRSLLTENQVIEKMIYKYTGPFRREQVLANLKKVNKCVKRYREMCVQSYMSEILAVIAESDNTRLPSAAMVTHLLQLLLRGSYCLQATTVECLHCYGFVKQKLHAAVFVPTMLIFAGALARVWFVCCALLKELTGLYEALEGQLSTIWSMDLDPNLPKSIKHLCPVYQNDGIDAGDALTVLTEEDQKLQNEEFFNMTMDTSTTIKTSKLADATEMVDVGTALSRQASDDNGNTVEDIGQSVTRPVTEEAKKEMDISRETEEKTDSDILSTSQQTEAEGCCKNNLIIKPTLKDFTLKVYSEKKPFKRVVKKLASLNCVLVLKDQKVELNSAACKKLLKEIKLQNDIVKSVKTVGDKVEKAKNSAKRLEKKINKYLGKNRKKHVDIHVKDIDEINDHDNQTDDQSKHLVIERSDQIDQDKDHDHQADDQSDLNEIKGLTAAAVKSSKSLVDKNVIKIPKKKLEQFTLEVVSDKAKRKSFVEKLKSGDCSVHYGKKKCKPSSDWLNNVLILFKHLSRDLKGKTDSKSKIFQTYSRMLIKQIKSVIK